MLLNYVAQYYKYVLITLLFIIFFKIVLSYSFNEKIRGLQGILYAIFKWYGQQEQEMEDDETRKIIMRFHNIVTLFMYVIIILLFIFSMLSKLLPH